MCIFVLCLIVVPLPQGKNPFAVQLNNNNNNNNNEYIWRGGCIELRFLDLGTICR
jgi:hypothetical protein